MPTHYPGTTNALSGLIGGVVRAQSPQSQLALARKAAEQDALAEQQRTREFLSNFDWTQPDATQNALKGLAAINPGVAAAPLFNYMEAQETRLRAEERGRALAETIRPLAPGGIMPGEEATIRARERELLMEPTRFMSPYDPLDLEALRQRGATQRAALRATGGKTLDDKWLEHQEVLQRLNYPEDAIEDARIEFYRTGGRYDVELLGMPRPEAMSTNEIDRLESLIISHPETSEVAKRLGYEVVTEEGKRTFLGIDPLAKDKPSPDVESVLAEFATGANREMLSPQLRSMVDRYLEALGQEELAEEDVPSNTRGSKKIKVWD